MEKAKSRLTVFFEEPFWVAVCEREADGRYEAAKFVFGAEPRDFEVYDLILTSWHSLRFSPSIEAAKPIEHFVNPKRLQREARKSVKDVGAGTKAQQALQLQREQCKLERKACSWTEREAEQARRFELHEAKRKEKHRGH